MGILKICGVFVSAILISACAHAEPSQNGQASQRPPRLIHGQNGQETTLTEALAKVVPGSVVIIGENHGLKTHQAQQLEIMKTLRSLGHKVSVGMEFFYYPTQEFVNQYRLGQLSEEDFLKKAEWGGTPFEFYRDQALFPNSAEGSFTWALNAPKLLTSKVAKQGLEALTTEESALLPPQFHLGRDSYKERFVGMMPHLPNPEAADRYFAAQSIWDDTMAWRATEFLQQHPEQTLVIVVGEFHVQYGGGLPDRVKARASQVPVLTFSQFNTNDLTDDEINQGTENSSKYGSRADYIWLAPAQ